MMEVELKNCSKLSTCAEAIRTCWDSGDKGGCYPTPTDEIIEKDRDLLKRVILKHKHGSTAEHLSYTFFIEGISRALLQELARHRIASLSVKSTRYTLKELKDEEPFEITNTKDILRAEKYLVFTGVPVVDNASIQALDNVRLALTHNVPNDKAKFCLPESYKTSMTWTINARSLQNFLALRTNKAALWEIRELAYNIYDNLPEEHKYLFEDCVYEERPKPFNLIFEDKE